MLYDFRAWLESELKLLGNNAHHAYASGQANMAKRALDAFDAEVKKTVYVPLDAAAARNALLALTALGDAERPELTALHAAIAAAVGESAPPPSGDREPL